MTKLREFKDNILLLKSTDETRKGNLLQCIRSENETHAISRKCPIRIIKKATRVRIKLSNEWDTRRFDDWRQHEGVKYQKEKKKRDTHVNRAHTDIHWGRKVSSVTERGGSVSKEKEWKGQNVLVAAVATGPQIYGPRVYARSRASLAPANYAITRASVSLRQK